MQFETTQSAVIPYNHLQENKFSETMVSPPPLACVLWFLNLKLAHTEGRRRAVFSTPCSFWGCTSLQASPQQDLSLSSPSPAQAPLCQNSSVLLPASWHLLPPSSSTNPLCLLLPPRLPVPQDMVLIISLDPRRTFYGLGPTCCAVLRSAAFLSCVIQESDLLHTSRGT